MDQEEVEDFSLFESTFVKEETELEENEKTREKCPILAESSVTIKQEIDEEEEEDSVLFETLLVKEETNLAENYKVRDLSPFSSVIVKEEVREDVQDYDEDKEETENTFEVNTPSTIKQEVDYEQEKKIFPFESIFIKEEREDEDEEEIHGYDDERKTENNNDIPEALSGAVVDVITNGDVAQRMRARFRSILFRRMPVTACGSASTSVSTIRNFVDRSGVSSGLVQTKSQPPRGGPFQCGECGMGFKNEQNMWMHEFACKENAAVSRAGNVSFKKRSITIEEIKETNGDAVRVQAQPPPFTIVRKCIDRREAKRLCDAARRAKMSDEQRARARERNRTRMAARRAAMNAVEAQEVRERERVRQANRRAALREKKGQEVGVNQKKKSRKDDSACLGALVGMKTQQNKTNLTSTMAKCSSLMSRGSVSGQLKETSTQRKRRLAKARQKYAEKRAGENEEMRHARLERRRAIRERETLEQRFARLERDRLRQLQTRSQEMPEQRALRLESVRKQVSRARAAETAKKRARLETDRLRHSRVRATGRVEQHETLEQHAARLEWD